MDMGKDHAFAFLSHQTSLPGALEYPQKLRKRTFYLLTLTLRSGIVYLTCQFMT